MKSLRKKYRRYRGYESLLVWSVLGLVLLGIVMVFSSSSVVASRKFGDPYYFFKKHLIFVILGSLTMVVVWNLPIKRFLNSRWTYLLLATSFVMLLITLSPLGHKVGGAKRWINLGFLSFQPLEFAKISLVFYLSYFFSNKEEIVKSYIGFVVPFLVTSVLALPLAFQPDFGGFMFLFMIFFLLAFAGGVNLFYLFSLIFPVGALVIFLIYYAPYRLHRLMSYICSLKGIDHLSYQIKQSIYALGCGGLFGVGLGESKQKLFYLPESFTDFVMSILGEEMGFLGLSFVFLCLGIIMFVVFFNVIQKEELWDKLVILGAGSILIVGALLHIAVVLGAVPPKGTPMPFISYGGSNLLAMFCCVGIILSTIKSEG